MTNQKNEFVVFVAAENEKLGITCVPFGMSEERLLQSVVTLPDGAEKSLSKIAFLHVTFNEAASKQDAVDLARFRKLRFIPENIIAGMRSRQPGIRMNEIREAFAERMAAYEAPHKTSLPPSDKEQIEALQRLMKQFENIFGAEPK